MSDASSTLLRPVIAIVGRPNVGKSTLFNRLVARRQSIVRDIPGVTRDRLYGRVTFERWQATVVDTGGFDPSSSEPLIEAVRRQVDAAIEEADLVLFVVDARTGATALDLEIASLLRRADRPVVLVANKVEGDGQEPALSELFRLGLGAPTPVSAEHGRGVAEMLEAVRERVPDAIVPAHPRSRPCTSRSSAGRTPASRRSSTRWSAASVSSCTMRRARHATPSTRRSRSTDEGTSSSTRPGSGARDG